ncbi:hypothetical protein ACB092_04G182400 [Castanea dentata]
MAFLSWPKESFQPFLLFASIFIAVLLSLFMKLQSGKRKFNLPPNPPRLPIIGNLHQHGNMPHLSLQSLAKKFGPIIYLQLGEVPTVVVSSARLAKEVMKTYDLTPSSRPKIFSAKHLFYNCTDVAFSPYGAYCRHIRNICILELLSAKRVQSYSFVREEEVARLVSGGEYNRRGFQKMLEEYQALLGGFSVGDFFPSMEFIHSLTGMKSRLQDTFQRFDKLFDQLLTEDKNPKREKEEQKDLVHVLLDIQKNDYDEMPLTTDNIKAIILDMFATGTDTTFTTLDWGMTELVINPKVMGKAQAEVRRTVGDRRVIYRLHPPAPVLLPRESTEEVNIDGCNIPAKTPFFVNAWAIGRDPEYWENPDVFEPERFMGGRSTVDFKGQHFELIPFGAGRRISPAITFGTASIELALAQLLHSFDWEFPPGVTAKDLDMTEAFGITMHRIANLIVIAKSHFPLEHANDNPKIY